MGLENLIGTFARPKLQQEGQGKGCRFAASRQSTKLMFGYITSHTQGYVMEYAPAAVAAMQ